VSGVIAIGGPIASGKSALARAVASELARRRIGAATIDLDLVYEMLEPTGAPKADAATWSRARRAAGALARALLEDGVEVVVVEGDLLHDSERADLAAALPDGQDIVFVTLTVALKTALARARRDPTRGISRDRDFLARHYRGLAATLQARPAAELCIDTGSVSIEQAAEAVLRRIGLARSR
jgi:adenylylsulfate kinase-like enzyme